MKFQIVDAHGEVILAWDTAEVARRAHPKRLHGPLRKRFEKRLARALENLKTDLFAL